MIQNKYLLISRTHLDIRKIRVSLRRNCHRLVHLIKYVFQEKYSLVHPYSSI